MSERTEPAVRSIGTDPVAFTEFYRAHVDEVTRFVARRVADPQLVADLTAEVFLAVIEAAERYRGSHGGPRTWLYGIARNVIAAEFRRSAREQRAERLIAGRRAPHTAVRLGSLAARRAARRRFLNPVRPGPRGCREPADLRG